MEKKILVVDDEASIRSLLLLNLRKAGYTALEAADGQRAIELAETEAPALMLLDLMLPGIDGFEICKRIREKKNTPILMVSAKKDDIDKIRGLGLGADDYMTKPIDYEELL